MSFLILFLCAGAAFGATVKINVHGVDKLFYAIEDAEMLFEQFLLDFDKKYDSKEEKAIRFEVFKNKIHHINKLNMKYDTVYGITEFSDMTDEEFSARFNSNGVDLEGSMPCPQAQINLNSLQLEASFDWRDQNAVTPVKNQYNCGACWAFSIIGSLESQYLKNKGQMLDLAEQQIVDCDTKNYGCGGGYPPLAGSYILQNGVMSESDYPYIDSQGTCAYDSGKVVARASSCLTFDDSSEEELKTALTQYGPLTIVLDGAAITADYKGGIIRNCYNTNCTHAVLLVGYNDGPDPYWTLKNSWGASWGEQGYFKIPLGSTACRISQCLGTTVFQL